MHPVKGKSIIVFILPSFAGGGAEKVMINFLKLTDRELFEPVLIVLNAKGPLADQVPDDVIIQDLATPRVRSALPKLIKKIRQLKPAAVFSTFIHTSAPLLFVGPLLGKIPIIVREANMPSANIPRMPWPWGFKKVYRYMYPRAKCVIATSKTMLNELTDLGVPANKIRILPNPVDEETLRARAIPMKRKSGKGIRLVAAGRLSHQKGFDRLLQELPNLAKDSHLTIFGEGPERSILEAIIKKLKLEEQVELAGFQVNIAQFIAGADVFVMPSRFEGMPNAALEALCLGVPVIATPESGGIGELKNVISAKAGSAFTSAILQHVRPVPTFELRASRLPIAYTFDAVSKQFNSLLKEVVHHD